MRRRYWLLIVVVALSVLSVSLIGLRRVNADNEGAGAKPCSRKDPVVAAQQKPSLAIHITLRGETTMKPR